MKYLNLNSEKVRETLEFTKQYVPLNEHIPNEKRCKNGHQYVNDSCINCGRILVNNSPKNKKKNGK